MEPLPPCALCRRPAAEALNGLPACEACAAGDMSRARAYRGLALGTQRPRGLGADAALRLIVKLPGPVGLDFRLEREGTLHRLGKLLHPEPQVGAPAFDQAVFIRSQSPDRASGFLAEPGVQAAATALIGATGALSLEADRLIVEARAEGTPLDAEAIERDAVWLACRLLDQSPS